LLEESFGRADSSVQEAVKADLNNVTSEGSDEGSLIIGGNNNALKFALDLTHVDFLGGDLLCDKVYRPDADAIVVDGDQLVVSGVEELDFIGDVVADLSPAKCFSSFDLNFKNRLD